MVRLVRTVSTEIEKSMQIVLIRETRDSVILQKYVYGGMIGLDTQLPEASVVDVRFDLYFLSAANGRDKDI